MSSDTEDEFRKRCDKVDGVVQFRKDGLFLECVSKIKSFTETPIIYFNAFSTMQEYVYAKYLRTTDTELNRLSIYFSSIYSQTPLEEWIKLGQDNLIELYKSLEIYYSFPDNILPRTMVTKRRLARENRFFRLPKLVMLQQKYYQLSDAVDNGGSIEVCHFGNLTSDFPLTNPAYFSGTYYYAATGSGVSLPVGSNSLKVWNKIHALHVMGITPEQMYENEQITGDKFRRAVKSYHRKYRGSRSFIKSLYYAVQDMVNGKAFEVLPGGKLLYFGMGESGDSHLAHLAVSRGYTSIQLVKEPQFGHVNSTPPVGFEIIDLSLPQKSSEKLDVNLKYPISI